MQLIICEKPSVAADVAAALGATTRRDICMVGADVVVTYAFGHLLQTADPAVYNPAWETWDFEALPMLPERFAYTPRDDKAAAHLAKIVGVASDPRITGLVNACDAGREGELIFALIRDHDPALSNLPVQRAWFSSMTHDAIRDAFGRLRTAAEMAPLEAAARARNEADWLVGINATRAASVTVGSRKVLSLGRVQTPTLALICERDSSIDAFVPEDFWTVSATFESPESTRFTARWFNDTTDRFTDPDSAGAVVTACKTTGRGVISSVVKTPVSENAPLLYDLTALQREANRRLGWTAAKTLTVAQACYETKKVLTYPRTDSRYLTTDMVAGLGQRAAALAQAIPDLAPATALAAAGLHAPTKRTVDDTKVRDHHAIIPTDTTWDLAALTEDERAMFELVARRFLAAHCPPATSERTAVVVDCANSTWRASGNVPIDVSWKPVDRPPTGAVAGKKSPPVDEDDTEGDTTAADEDQELPALTVGTQVRVADATANKGTTRPPARYNESSLLGAMETAGKLCSDEDAALAMEERGLGTPATRAATIERLITVGFVQRTGRSLRATWRGRALIGLLGPDSQLASAEMTGRWEKALGDIEDDAGDLARFDAAIRRFATDTVAFFRGRTPPELMAHRPVVGTCPRCQKRVMEGERAWGCESYQGQAEPGCGFVIWKEQSGKKVTAAQLRKAIATDQPRIGPPQVEVGPCPNDGCEGTIVSKAKGFGCNSWRSKDEPGCGFVIWQRAPKPYTIEEVRGMVAAGRMHPEGWIAPEDRTDLGPCPVPGCSGTIRQMASGKGWSCNSWTPPKTKKGKPGGCGTVVWKSRRDGTVLDDAAARAELAKIPATAST